MSEYKVISAVLKELKPKFRPVTGRMIGEQAMWFRIVIQMMFALEKVSKDFDRKAFLLACDADEFEVY